MTKAVCSISIIFVIIGQISATTTNSPIVSPQCYNYTLINDPTRSINVTSSGSSACDTSIFSSTPMWVRFVGSGGSTIPTSAVAYHQCNTDAPGWYSGNMSIDVDTTTSGSVCFAWGGSNCSWNSTISVTNCGWYYVYELVAPSTCSLRYCTDEPTNWTEPTTPAPTSNTPIVSPQCYNYTLINDPTRSIYVTSNGSSVCDQNIFSSTPIWVRFVGSGGSTIPTSAVAYHQCNTDAPGWYSGNIPITVNTTTTGSVCFAWSGSNCSWNTTISVTNCGWYYVYELVAPPACSLRYCTDEPTNWTEPTTEMATEGK
ncbi:unnamed protein product [Adineta ricciae]|uniref:UMOD/GP2/OIT3-like D8C domain-containing protein n=1 Tax=Adineta ricciae TaxID=249248 RepID=A0A815DSS0_ADIRI|nr:unnamed protein product [Adineta ricciae]